MDNEAAMFGFLRRKQKAKRKKGPYGNLFMIIRKCTTAVATNAQKEGGKTNLVQFTILFFGTVIKSLIRHE